MWLHVYLVNEDKWFSAKICTSRTKNGTIKFHLVFVNLSEEKVKYYYFHILFWIFLWTTKFHTDCQNLQSHKSGLRKHNFSKKFTFLEKDKWYDLIRCCWYCLCVITTGNYQRKKSAKFRKMTNNNSGYKTRNIQAHFIKQPVDISCISFA